MSVQFNTQTQTQLDRVNRELTTLQSRRAALENQQTRLNLLHQFQQHGVTGPLYPGFPCINRGRLS